MNVNVYADSLSGASGTYILRQNLTGYSGTGPVSYTSVNFPGSAISGQSVNFNGQPALTIAADSSNPPAGNVVQGSTGNSLAVYRFTETSDVENVKVTQMNVIDELGANEVTTASTTPGTGQTVTDAAFSGVSLWNGSTELGTAQSPVSDASDTGYIYVFNSFTNPLIVPQGGSVSLTLKGNAGRTPTVRSRMTQTRHSILRRLPIRITHLHHLPWLRVARLRTRLLW